MVPPRIDVARVHALVRSQRVVPHPLKYHAGRHGIGFAECLAALERCYAVQADERLPDAWYALARHTHRRTLRIDFDTFEDEAGDILLLVTAYHV